MYLLLLSLWFLTDILLFIGVYTLAYFFRVGWILSTDFPFEPYLIIVSAIAPIWLIVLITTRTFALTRNQATVRNLAYMSYAGVVGVALFTLAYYFTFGLFFSRLLLIYALGLSIAIPFVWHMLYERLLRSIVRLNPPCFPTLIVGVNRESTRLIHELNKRKNPLKPVAILDGRGAKEKEIDGVPVIGKLNKLENVLDDYGITHLIQCSDLEQSLNLLSACRQQGITYMLLPSVLGIVERDESIAILEGQAVTMVRPGARKWGWFFR